MVVDVVVLIFMILLFGNIIGLLVENLGLNIVLLLVFCGFFIFL